MRTLMATLAASSLLLATSTLAQQPPPPEERAAQPPPASQPAEQQEHSREMQQAIPLAQGKPAQQQPLVSTQALVGTTVKNAQGEELGQIEELMIDAQSGQVQYAVLASGGVLGVGGERYSLPWETLKMGLGKDELVVEVDKAQLQKAASGSPSGS